MNRISETVKHIIIINVIMFFATMAMPEKMHNLFDMHFILNPLFKPWQIITHMFMHANLTHIGFNMLILWMFGTPIEEIWGKKRFVIFYFVAGLGSLLLYGGIQYFQFTEAINQAMAAGIPKEKIFDILNSGQYFSNFPNTAIYNSAMLGASGAIMGIEVAFAMMFPNVELMLLFPPIPVKAKYLISVLVLGDLFFGITSFDHSNIAHFAHVGGALTGFILVKIWGKYRHKRWY